PAAGAVTTPAPGSVPGATTPAPAPGSVPGAATATPAPGSVPGATAAITPAAAAAAAAAASRASSLPANGSTGQDTHESAAARPDPYEERPAQAFDDQDDGSLGFPSGRTGLIIGGAVAAVLAAVVLMVVLTSGGGTAKKPNDFGVVTQAGAASPAAGAANASAGSPSTVDRRATRVAVLNGTTQTGLARTVADEVEKAKFTISGTENNADQAVPTTTVSYRDGNQRAAQVVAQVLGIDRASVQPVDANASVAADADVVVIVGADKIG
ncbi:MAG: hypothetical protein QOE11_114, partial [Solirubrobacteraceae bacterium]|nr:hypothetical protein [Solirubrobacteraceae bacterium]